MLARRFLSQIALLAAIIVEDFIGVILSFSQTVFLSMGLAILVLLLLLLTLLLLWL